ncbi:hypothetical protein FKW77_009268 [Venturia effusa]|uniref:Uncharacterized protein n=1 Tax=Venturia effusa TaxID=50376 RepID=A0A517LD34_9PEZI|nr:hypothetical protein FKW77_009268 [Venturia effusa]
MPWMIEKKAADIQTTRVTAVSESAKTIEIPAYGLMKAYLADDSSSASANPLLSSLHERIQYLASKITGRFKEPFDPRAQYRLSEDSEIETTASTVLPKTRSTRASRESAYQTWRAESLLNGDREFDVEDLDPLPPSAGLDTRLRLKM